MVWNRHLREARELGVVIPQTPSVIVESWSGK
jgi:hypothetical protein